MPLITVSYTTSRQSPSLKSDIANAVSGAHPQKSCTRI